GSAHQVVATSQGAGGRASSEAPGAAQLAGPSISGAFPAPSKFSRLFTRQANGVDIRAFVVSSPGIQPLSPATGVAAPACITMSRLQAELSTPGMVAMAGGGGFVTQQPGAAIVDVAPAIVGEAEGDPVAVVVVMTGPAVAKVRMSFSGGATDEMAPREGWAVLAAPASWFQPGKAATTTQLGTLTVSDSGGRTVGARTLTWPPAPTPAPGVVPGSGGSAGSGSGTAGSGTVSSGTVSSGTAGSSGSSGSTATGSGEATSPATAYPCQVPPPCAGYPNGISCPAPSPMPAVTAPNKAPSNSATTPATGSGG
ncbi:MAG TPA: hypothetical protein VFJ79_07300, partial [Acidimicrobiales bacterium]|nr:hypothetical protein [Acidimicrobiales bacterium]